MSNDTDDLKPESTEPELTATPEIEDPIGDVSDGEGHAALGDEIEAQIDAADEVQPEAAASEGETPAEAEEDEPEFTPKPKPPAKLERLQKILAQAGIASRRKAEEMIEQGRVQVNGKVVTELGTKADAGRDHIRVDGKLLQGAERLRYFVLNKPKGFVTTVKDPEGRPTVMQFFDKMRERLYPVGRLDYMSEGLLLVTNDGELANRLTRAAAGVEKTYLVKVAGQPTEDQLDLLRGGVTIERGKPGSGQVRTSPARIRQVRQGDNPWYEVVLIEGRNRELRKMFEEIGHFVEKIRRVGYGPLVLDQEPGNLRELQPAELDALRRVAEGKLRTPKSKELRRRNAADKAMLPTVVPKPTVHKRPAKPFATKPLDEGSAAAAQPGEFRPKRTFGTRALGQGRPARPGGEAFRPAASRPPARDAARGPARGPAGAEDRPRRSPAAGPAKYSSARPVGRPAWQKEDRRPPARFSEGATGENRPPTPRTYGAKPATGKPYGDKPTGRPYTPRPASDRPYGAKPAGKPYGDKPAPGRAFGAKPAAKKWDKPGSSDRPAFKRPAPRREDSLDHDDLGPIRPPNLHIEEIPQSERSSSPRPASSRPSAPRSYVDRPTSSHQGSGRASSPRPFRSEGGLTRPFTTSSGKPRPGGARPSSKPTGRSYGPGPRSGSGSIEARTGSGYRPPPGGKRPYAPRPAGSSDTSLPHTKKFAGSRETGPRREGARPERNAGTGWKPKTRYGPGKSSSGAGSRPAAGGASKSGYKGSSYKAKPSSSGAKRPAGKNRP
jgi:23S rRNA pseudouridine2605 synthase